MNILADFAKALRTPQIWLGLGFQDFLDQYSRAYFGVAWAIVQPALWIFAISLFFRPLVGSDPGFYMAYISVGIVAYNFITSSLTDGGNAFIRRGGLIQNFALPLFSHIFRDTAKATVRLLLQALIVVAVFIYYGIGLSQHAWQLLPAFGILLVACVGTSLLISVATAWSGDLQHAISSVMRLVFFATPIIWLIPDEPGLRKTLAHLNPFTHFIEIVRAPLLGSETPYFSWVFVVIITGTIVVLALFAGRIFGRRVPYWVAT